MTELTGVPIVYVNNFPGPRMGGGEAHLLHLVRGAIAAGMEVTVVAMPASGTAAAAREAGARVVEDELTRGVPFGAASRLGRYLRDANAGIVHGTGFYANLLARRAGHRAGALVVDGVHCEPASTLAFDRSAGARASQAARSLADAATRGRADAVICDSRALADAVIAAGTPAGIVTVIHNGIDPGALAAAASEAASAAEREGGTLTVGTLGRVEPVKGLGFLLDAARLVAAVHPEARFLVAGEGPERDVLEARVASDEAIAGRVRFLGFVPDGPAFLASLDVYCLASLSEGFNTTVLEAMALGVPVVATDVGGTREAVIDGKTGRLVAPGDPAALASAVSHLLGDGAERERLSAEARALVEREFTVARMVERTLGVYRRLLAPAGV
ncbi:MAG TPA: glycosyltransferase family 4 protein [Coriobacteriia bacterium]